jgi:hypothetical protein
MRDDLGVLQVKELEQETSDLESYHAFADDNTWCLTVSIYPEHITPEAWLEIIEKVVLLAAESLGDEEDNDTDDYDTEVTDASSRRKGAMQRYKKLASRSIAKPQYRKLGRYTHCFYFVADPDVTEEMWVEDSFHISIEFAAGAKTPKMWGKVLDEVQRMADFDIKYRQSP